MSDHIDIVFDGPPGPEAGRFVEVENEKGHSISLGEWVHRPDGYWALRFYSLDQAEQLAAEKIAEEEAREERAANGQFGVGA